MRKSGFGARTVLLVVPGVLFSVSAAFGGVLTASYPSALPGGVVPSPAFEALPGAAVAVDYVNIGDVESEVGHNLVGWGPVEPATNGGVWGLEPTTRVIWEAGCVLGSESASIDLDFGSTLGTKYLALRWLDGISNGDSFDITISTIPGGVVVFSGSVTDGTTGHPETWYDLGVWNVGPITGMHTVTLTATDGAWSMCNTYGQVGFSEMATFVANCCPEPPYSEPPEDGILALPMPVPEPPGAVQVDFVDIGKPASEAGHNMPIGGANGWGPVEPLTHGGGWGGEDDCRVIWEGGGDRSATIDMDFGEAQGKKYVALRWLDGISYNDSFDMTVQGVATTFSLTNGTIGHPENWYFICAWDVGDIRGVRTITLTATGSAWGGQPTYGQGTFSQIATLSDACEAECNPDLIPAEIGIVPDLVPKPAYATRVDYVDIGDATSETGHNMSLSGTDAWGPVEPATTGGGWGGEDDCRVIWEAGTTDYSATVDMNFGPGTGNKYFALRWLDGMANTGAAANDSFDIAISTIPGGVVVFSASVTNGTASHPETWYNLCVWDVGAITGTHTVTLTATGGPWSHQSTYGQVAFSAVATYDSDIPIEPGLVALPDRAVPVDFVDIGDGTSEAGHAMTSWGLPEPATSGGSWGGEDDCKVIWEPGGSTSATIDMDFGTGTGNKYLGVRWLDGMANMGGAADDSFTVAVSGFGASVTNGTANHPETWYDLYVWDVGPMIGVQTVTLTATGGAWSGQGTYGQVAFSTITTYEEFCDDDPPSGIDVEPSLASLPDGAVTIDYVDIGDTTSESGHNLQGWGPVVPPPGNWGGEDDCRVIWENTSPSGDPIALVGKCATVDLDFGAALGTTKYLVMRWLDGLANDGTTAGAHDSFRVHVSGSDMIYTVHDNTVGQGENWYDLCAFDVGDIKGIHTVTLCATGGRWAGFGTYGQVGFSEMATKVACEESGTPCPMANVAVRLIGVDGPVTRCVRFTLADNSGCAIPVDVDVLLTGDPATGTATFEVEEGDWMYLNAKDEQHVVSDTSLLTLIGTTYYAEISLDLQGGDTDNNDLVDIDDVTWLIATFGDPAHGGTHPWDGTRCADFSNDGSVATEDFTFLSANWLTFGGFECGSAPAGSAGSPFGSAGEAVPSEVKTSVDVTELPAWVAARADLNRDGVVDAEDVKQFEESHDLGNELSSKIEMTASLKETKKASVRHTRNGLR